MTGKVSREKYGYVFKDDDGVIWTEEQLSELINAMKKLKAFKETFEYYASRLL